jgi:high-affinity iron transporter
VVALPYLRNPYFADDKLLSFFDIINDKRATRSRNDKKGKMSLLSTTHIITAVVSALMIASIILMPMLTIAAYAQRNTTTPLTETNALIVMVNIQRIQAQLLLTENSLANGDRDMAFAHAYIPHSTTFPTIKSQLRQVDETSAGQIESMLTDLPLTIKSGASLDKVRQDIAKIKSVLDYALGLAVGSRLQTDNGIVAQSITYLLQDAAQSYQLSNAGQPEKGFSKVDYENAIGLVQTAESNYAKIAGSLDNNGRGEIDSFFPELNKAIEGHSNYETGVSRWIDGIQRSLSASTSPSSSSSGGGGVVSSSQANGSGYAQYFSTIRTLLKDVIVQTKNGNYEKAGQEAVTAYLDNYEYLEPPIQKHDSSLFVDKEMRDVLRQMLREKRPAAEIETFINDKIFVKLDQSEAVLKNDPLYNHQQQQQSPSLTNGSNPQVNIAQLKAGFGTYTGEKKQIGQANDSAKTIVRGNIDQIRLKLDNMLTLYSQGNYDGSQLAARSAYLDSYESIEIPLRPINPDFTLDMEIKFGELRNLIQAKSQFEKVEAKVSEIKAGLDESERLVSGTGVIAPTIAFSTSFSIIFREGLESALIIGAILTYLAASRNEKYNKHVYYGIVIAIAATAATWFAAQFIIEISGASRDLIEAIAGISATAVLFWVSFWILNKVETKRWIEFVKAKVWKATTTGSVMVFAMLSFFTVYREGFETVLFYQAMLSFAKYMEWYVVLGLVAGMAVILGIVFIIRKMGKKLPLRVLFALTMAVGAYMSIAFIGNAVREFQDVGYISTTHMIGIIPRLDINLASMTGIHPTLETVIAQLILLSVYVVGSLYILIIRPRRVKEIESARKSRADLDMIKDKKGGGIGSGENTTDDHRY